MSSIFRKDALDNNRRRINGSIYLLFPFSFLNVSLLLTLFFLMMLVGFNNVNFSDTVRAKGVVSEEEGIVNVISSAEGVLVEVPVSEGDLIKAGEPLAILKHSNAYTNDVSYYNRTIKKYAERELLLIENRELLKSDFDIFHKKMKKRITGYDAKIALSKEKNNILREILVQKESLTPEILSLKHNDYISLQYLNRHNEDIQNTKIKIIDNKNRVLDSLESKALIEDELRIANKKYMAAINDIEMQLIDISYQRDLLISGNITTYSSPITGTVSDIFFGPDDYVRDGEMLMSLTEENVPLRAELAVSARAISYVSEGKRVKIKYESFPYEKYGYYYGVIKHVGSVPISNIGFSKAEINDEASFRVLVELEHRHVTYEDNTYNLRAGMGLEAIIEIEKQTLLSFLIDRVLKK